MRARKQDASEPALKSKEKRAFKMCVLGRGYHSFAVVPVRTGVRMAFSVLCVFMCYHDYRSQKKKQLLKTDSVALSKCLCELSPPTYTGE